MGRKGMNYAGMKRTGNQTSDMEKEEQMLCFDPVLLITGSLPLASGDPFWLDPQPF